MDVYELDWDLGTSIIIPLKRRYDSIQNFTVAGRTYPVRLIEIMVLSGLLRLVHGDKSENWRSAKAAAIITRGWGEMAQDAPPPVSRSD
ncbi:MAG TPA: hypothetical protein PK307_03030 [Spirochaetota bacterium]|nr:hypothetical protein [Spirochaetota bacterium]